MRTIAIEPGMALGLGGSNARRAVCKEGDIEGFVSVSTPQQSREFFGWMARQVLHAADAGHTWMVVGYPGPVEGEKVGPLANVPGLSKSQYKVSEELAAAEPAAGRLLDEGFTLIHTNDGSLAAHAAALRVGHNRYGRVAALIAGTGVGAGIVDKDLAYENVYRVDRSHPNEIGHILRSPDPHDTFENAISGTALARTYDMAPQAMPASHPAWRRVGEGIGMLATNLGVMNGVELVVPCGGVGSGASEKYGPHLTALLDTYRAYGNGPQQLFVPEVAPVPPEDCQVFELFGAEGVIADYYTAH